MDADGEAAKAAARAGPWAGGGDDDMAAMLATFQEKLPVRLISTPRPLLSMCHPDEEVAAVVARNADGFDHFPVAEPDGEARERIVGLLQLVPFMQGETPRGLVRDRMETLSEDNLIGADAGILSFVRKADRQMCRLVVSGSAIDGLVTLSDLQRLPVRAALFAMVTHLEITMTEAIRREFGTSDDWLSRLSDDKADGIRQFAEAARERDAFVETLLLTDFAHKEAIIRKSPAFPWSSKQFKSELNRIQTLRNDLAHAKNYAATRCDAKKTCGTVRLMDEWIGRLSTWQPAPTGPAG